MIPNERNVHKTLSGHHTTFNNESKTSVTQYYC